MALFDEVYVDPSIAADSGTGTIGDPYGDLQYAITTEGANPSGGRRYNVKAGTAEFDAAITLPTGNTAANPTIIQGYTSAAGDGGIGVIDGSGAMIINQTAYDFLHIVNMKFTDYGANHAVDIDNDCAVYECEFEGGGVGNGIAMDNDGVVAFCKFTGISNAMAFVADCMSFGNWIECTHAAGSNIIASCHYAIHNVIWSDQANEPGIDLHDGSFCAFNSIYCDHGTPTTNGISSAASDEGNKVINNYIEGWDVGINAGTDAHHIVLGNRFYNNNTNENNTTHRLLSSNNSALAASGLTDGTNKDFTPTQELIDEIGEFATFWQTTQNHYPTIGAVIAEAAAGGGGAIVNQALQAIESGITA